MDLTKDDGHCRPVRMWEKTANRFQTGMTIKVTSSAVWNQADWLIKIRRGFRFAALWRNIGGYEIICYLTSTGDSCIMGLELPRVSRVSWPQIMSWGRKTMAVIQNVTPTPHIITHWNTVRARADIVIKKYFWLSHEVFQNSQQITFSQHLDPLNQMWMSTVRNPPTKLLHI